jgi:hypothetical protein
MQIRAPLANERESRRAGFSFGEVIFAHFGCLVIRNCAHFAWPGSGQIYNRLSLFLMKRANNKTNWVPLPYPLTEEDSPGEDAE